MDARRLDSQLARPAAKVASIVVVAAFVALCMLKTDSVYRYRALFTGRNSFAAVGEWCSWANRLLTYVASTVVGLAVLGCSPARKVPVASVVGTRTLQVYAFHYELICIVSHLGLYPAVQASVHGWLLLIPLGLAFVLLLSIRWVGWPLQALERRLGAASRGKGQA